MATLAHAMASPADWLAASGAAVLHFLQRAVFFVMQVQEAFLHLQAAKKPSLCLLLLRLLLRLSIMASKINAAILLLLWLPLFQAFSVLNVDNLERYALLLLLSLTAAPQSDLRVVVSPQQQQQKEISEDARKAVCLDGCTDLLSTDMQAPLTATAAEGAVGELPSFPLNSSFFALPSSLPLYELHGNAFFFSGGCRCVCSACRSVRRWVPPYRHAADTRESADASASHATREAFSTSRGKAAAGKPVKSEAHRSKSCPHSCNESSATSARWAPGAPPAALLLGTSLTTSSSDWLLLLLQHFRGEALAVNNGEGPLDLCFDFTAAQQETLTEASKAIVTAALLVQQEQSEEQSGEKEQQQRHLHRLKPELLEATSQASACREDTWGGRRGSLHGSATSPRSAAAARLREALSSLGPQFEYGGAAAPGQVAVTCRSRRVLRIREDLEAFLRRLCPLDLLSWLERHYDRLKEAHRKAVAAAARGLKAAQAAATARGLK
ncbi:hypothetical protein cyc_08417 [Cyclospora cayetanensis]|uniref:Uncharacterized protein n=1 Tax=Cyclospora cayetanensis TaxID=88456 RepID=A0A1D3DA92_9EIME|nr:hypothetical protein cyc_08417 [Cyclospora cayetanensis]